MPRGSHQDSWSGYRLQYESDEEFLRERNDRRVAIEEICPIGTMVMWLADDIPDKWLEADASWQPKAKYPELAKLFKNRFASDRKGEFLMPDMGSFVPIGVGLSAAEVGDVVGPIYDAADDSVNCKGVRFIVYAGRKTS